MSNSYLFIGLFIVCLVAQYVRYRHLAKNTFAISGLLLIKFLIRSLILGCLLVIMKNMLFFNNKVSTDNSKALFIITSKSSTHFKLSEDDQVNISSRIPNLKFKQLELWLYDTSNAKYYVLIPATSEKTFIHLLTIDRLNEIAPYKLSSQPDGVNRTANRIEMYQGTGNQWRRSELNQTNFNLLKLIDYENELVSPYLVQYLLILLSVLLAFDLGFKYRILKF